MLMTVVSLSVFAQYPTTKKLNGTKVVIMTVPQAEKINEKFDVLEDSISNLNLTVKHKTSQLSEEEKKTEKIYNNLLIANSNLAISYKEIDSLKKENKRIEKLEYIEKRTRVRITTGLFGTLSAWIILAIISIKS